MRILYDIFFLLFSVLYVPILFLKGKGHREFVQKFSFLPEEVKKTVKPVWIHAVSVGEAAVAAKIAALLKEKREDIHVVVSTTTRTGNNMIRKVGKGTVDAVFYYPLDISFIVSRVIRLIDPSLYIMIETELWPNILEEFKKRKVPVVLANGRISDNSFHNYERIKFITQRILKCIDVFCMQSEKDAQRIEILGARKEDVFVTGNIKFDEEKQQDHTQTITRDKVGFGSDDSIIIAGSTHSPEEQEIINVFKHLKETRGGVKLILAPRHVERMEAIKIYAEKAGLKHVSLSRALQGSRINEVFDVLLVDTIGHLKDLYAIGDVVFVGGSLAKKGGQNPIEAAKWGKPIIFGPHMYNFREIARVFTNNKVAVQVGGIEELQKVLIELLNDRARREEMSNRAVEVIEENAGAVDRTIGKIEELLEKQSTSAPGHQS